MVHGLLKGSINPSVTDEDPIINNTNHRKVVTEIQPYFQIQGLTGSKKPMEEEDARSIRRSNQTLKSYITQAKSQNAMDEQD